MGYILPVNPYQSIAYANRIDYRNDNMRSIAAVKGTLPVFALTLQARMAEHPPMPQINMYPRPDVFAEYRKNTFQPIKWDNMSYITGKGYMIDRYV